MGNSKLSRRHNRLARCLNLLGLIGVLAVAVLLRWRYIVNVQPFPDEFVTLLAVKMILEKGVPVLPSGLFYEHGLLFSYAGAVTSALLGFSREVVRGTSLFFGLLTALLTWYAGRRWFSVGAGLLATTLLAVAPAAMLWGGRARMYTLLQGLVLLTVFLAFYGVLADRPAWRRLALVCYLAATLAQFVAITLVLPLAVALIVVGWLDARRREERPWLQSPQVWLEVVGLVLVVLVAFLVKRAGQPKGIAPLEKTGMGVVVGLVQVAAIYADLSPNLVTGWRALASFFTAPEAIVPTALAVLAAVWGVVNAVRRRITTRDLPTLFLALILIFTTLEMIFLVSPDRRDDKYLFMLQPALFLLAADGLTRLGSQISNLKYQTSNLQSFVFSLISSLALIAYTWPATSALLARSGSDYDTAFGYVREHWQEGDQILTGTPAAAAIYLGRNDYYAVSDVEGYAYRILERDGHRVERWTGSPWLETDEAIHTALNTSSRVWLVLERWGLTKEYYTPLTMQRILAMTDFVREDKGIIVLRSREAAPLIPEDPEVRTSVNFDQQVSLEGYSLIWQIEDALEEERTLALVLHWQALQPMPFDYTVFVHLRDGAGNTVAQADHRPLAPVYPTTLWPVGQTIREHSVILIPDEVPPGTYSLWVGLYRLDTLERLPIIGDESGEHAVLLAEEDIP